MEISNDFLLNSPLRRGAKINLTRSKDTGRAPADYSADEYK